MVYTAVNSQIFNFAKALNKYYEHYKRQYGRDVVYNLNCPECQRGWSLFLDHGTEHLVISKELYCPWCGYKYQYVSDAEFR